MAEDKQQKKSNNAGKFMLGAAVGAALGFFASKLLSVKKSESYDEEDDELDELGDGACECDEHCDCDCKKDKDDEKIVEVEIDLGKLKKETKGGKKSDDTVKVTEEPAEKETKAEKEAKTETKKESEKKLAEE